MNHHLVLCVFDFDNSNNGRTLEFRNAKLYKKKRWEVYTLIYCGGCWSGCRKRGSDGGKRGSSKNISLFILLQSGKLEAYKMVHTTGKKSTESAQQLKERRKTGNLNGPNTEKYFRPDPELACRYLEENIVMSLQLRNASSCLTIFTNTFSGNADEAYEKLEVVFSL